MSEIRDTVIKEAFKRLDNAISASFDGCSYHYLHQTRSVIVFSILSIPEIAIVDRDAELPTNPHEAERNMKEKQWHMGIQPDAEEITFQKAQQDMREAGWVKEVRNDAG